MSSKNTNKLNVPQARAAMDKFKMEAANEVGVNLKQGYNGDLTSREAGSVGGQMVKKMIEIPQERIRALWSICSKALFSTFYIRSTTINANVMGFVWNFLFYSGNIAYWGNTPI